MGSGKDLTEAEKAQVLVLHNEGYSNRNIAKIIGRSRGAVGKCILNNNSPVKRSNSGRKRKLSPRTVYLLERTASNNETSSLKLIHDLQINVSKWTVLRRLKECPHLNYEKKLCKPPLTWGPI